MEGPGSGKGPAAWLLVGGGGAGVRGPSVENIFPTPIALGQEGASLSLLREGDYRSELQSMLNLANCWPEGARRGQVRSGGPDIGLVFAAQPGAESPDPR